MNQRWPRVLIPLYVLVGVVIVSAVATAMGPTDWYSLPGISVSAADQTSSAVAALDLFRRLGPAIVGCALVLLVASVFAGWVDGASAAVMRLALNEGSAAATALQRLTHIGVQLVVPAVLIASLATDFATHRAISQNQTPVLDRLAEVAGGGRDETVWVVSTAASSLLDGGEVSMAPDEGWVPFDFEYATATVAGRDLPVTVFGLPEGFVGPGAVVGAGLELQPGDEFLLGGHPIIVAEVDVSLDGVRRFGVLVPIEVVNSVVQKGSTAPYGYLVSPTAGSPNLSDLPPGAQAIPHPDWVELNAEAWDGNAAGLILSIVAKQTVGFSVAFLAIGISQLAVVRRRELNMLRAIGGSGLQILWMLAIASGLRSLGAAVVGLPLAWLVQELVVNPSTIGFDGSIRLDEYLAAVSLVLVTGMGATLLGFRLGTRDTISEGLR